MPSNLRVDLGSLIDALNKARNNSDDPAEQAQLQKVIRVLKERWDNAILQSLDATTPEYAAATKAVADAEASARQGLSDAKKVEEAVAKAAEVAKLIDNILGFAGPILARS